jgi:hypothetical protein
VVENKGSEWGLFAPLLEEGRWYLLHSQLDGKYAMMIYAMLKDWRDT